ncbi:tetratricopeptide repeat protein [Lacibacter sp. H375]|uniref:tetratricopeptide repeat protein n=1 Tax=Lacibacter sp. H375 TaxID=3133424 RepID=UPI0030BE4BF3
MKKGLQHLTLCLLFFISFQCGFSQSESVLKELRDADTKYQYGKKYEEAKSIYLKYSNQLTPQQQLNLAICYLSDPARSAESYAKGIEWLNKAAERGNTEAMRTIAYCFETGLGVKKDSIQQIAWTKKASDFGDAAAMLAMGYYHQYGKVVPKDEQKAKELYLKAIDKGNREASYYLAMLERGKGNFTSSLHYLEKSANGGFAAAQFELGDMYEKGTNGVQQDLDEATRWYGKINSRQDTRDYYNAAMMRIRSFGTQEPSTDPQKINPLLLKLVARANESFYDIKGKLITPYNKPMYDNLGSSKSEYYAPLLQLGFKNAYIQKNNFNQVQKNNSVKNVDNYTYHAEIIHSSAQANSYRVYMQWATILKNLFPGWKQSEENFPNLQRGETTQYQHHSNGRTTIIVLKTCCPNDKVEIEIKNNHNPQ